MSFNKKRVKKILPKRIDLEIKKQILKEIQMSGKSVKEVALEYDVLMVTIYAWMKKDAEEGGNTSRDTEAEEREA